MDIKRAIYVAELWEAGKMIGDDENEVRNALLAEVKWQRVLLGKYINHVMESEGTDFLTRSYVDKDCKPFTKEEFEILESIASKEFSSKLRR